MRTSTLKPALSWLKSDIDHLDYTRGRQLPLHVEQGRFGQLPSLLISEFKHFKV